MKVFGWSPHYCRNRITSAEGWVWYNWAKENETTMLGAVWERSGKGYVGQEADKLFERAMRMRKS